MQIARSIKSSVTGIFWSFFFAHSCINNVQMNMNNRIYFLKSYNINLVYRHSHKSLQRFETVRRKAYSGMETIINVKIS